MLNRLIRLTKKIISGDFGGVRKELNSGYIQLLKRWYQRNSLSGSGIDIIEKDWDYLILLDACRFDQFKEVNWLPGQLRKVDSKGSSTTDWLKANFPEYYEDVLYISANPHISDQNIGGFKGTNHFFQVENVWEYGWDEELDTVPPNKVVDAGIKSAKKYPEKRMIVHFVQPHGPWIGEKSNGKSLNKKIGGTVKGRWELDIRAWDAVKRGELDVGEIRNAARANLEYVLKHVERFLRRISGDIVITSDHGESFGENFVYGHPPGVYTGVLTEVPWFRYKPVKGSEVDSESANESNKKESRAEEVEDRVEEKLRNLGYLD